MTLVRNRQPGPTILDDRNADVVITWEGAGHPQGEDVQDVPETVMKNVGLVRSIRKGVLEVVVEDASTTNDRFARQSVDFDKAAKAQHAAVMDTLEPSSRDKDLIEYKCLISGDTIIMSERDHQDRPPLADRYADRAGEFVAVETGRLNAQGKSIISWIRVVVGDELPSQQGA